MKYLLAATFLIAASAKGELTSFGVRPSSTDPDIRLFDDPHMVYIDRDIVVSHSKELTADRHELLVFLPGTNGKARGGRAFLTLAASLGYHAVCLMYPDDIAATTCDYDPNPNAFEIFRMAIIQGGRALVANGKRELDVSRTDSIENRLAKLLRFLQQIRPKEEWGQFLSDDGTLKWSAIAVAGQSQGGGHAALIGIKHQVARVICFGAPKDFSIRLNAPAAWYSDDSATPKDRFFAFNHVQDPVGCTPQQLWRNLQSIEGSEFGTPSQVENEFPPYHHARVLYTDYPSVNVTGPASQDALVAHGSPINSNNAERRLPQWTYLLTEPTQQ
jgi:hypothetical protein